MFFNLDRGKSLALLCLIAVHLVIAADASAARLPAEQLADCQLHVIGIYSPKDSHSDDRVYVEVKPTENPIVLVLSGYFGAQWNLAIDPSADVRQIIVAGYFEHSVVGVPDDIPVEMLTYFPKADKSEKDYFWAYSLHTQNGRELRNRLKELTGLEITSFQGQYSGEHFTVDAKVGLVGDAATPDSTAERPAGASQAIQQQLRAQGLDAKSKLSDFVAQFGSDHPVVKQIQASIDQIETELQRMGVQSLGNDAKPKLKRNGDLSKNPRETIEALVRQTFQLQTQLQMTRVKQAEDDLKRVKTQLQQRQASAEAIIAARVDELLQSIVDQSGGPASERDAEIKATLLANEGWQAWRARDLRTALDKFHDALEKNPSDQNALNGLGWTYCNLGEFDKAIVEFKKLLKESPTHGAALNGVGQCLLGLGKLDEAERELLKATEEAIAERGEAATAQMGLAAWYGLIRVYLEKGDATKAKAWIERSLKHKPADETMKAMLAQAEAITEAAD